MVQCDAARQVQKGGLGHRICSLLRDGFQGRDRAGEDQRPGPGGDHSGQNRAGKEKGGLHIDGHHRIPVSLGRVDHAGGSKGVDPGIAEQHVDGAGQALHRGGNGFGAGGISDDGADRGCKFPGQVGQPGGVPVHQGQMRALTREIARGLRPKASGRTDDHHRFAIEPHQRFPATSCSCSCTTSR